MLTLEELETLPPLGIEDEPHPVVTGDDARTCDIFVTKIELLFDPTGRMAPQIEQSVEHCRQPATHALYSNCAGELKAISEGKDVKQHINYVCTQHVLEAKTDPPDKHECPGGHPIIIQRIVPLGS